MPDFQALRGLDSAAELFGNFQNSDRIFGGERSPIGPAVNFLRCEFWAGCSCGELREVESSRRELRRSRYLIDSRDSLLRRRWSHHPAR